VAVPGLICLAFTFGSVSGRRYDVWLRVIWRYLRQPKIYVWQHLALTLPITNEQGEKSHPSQSPESEI